MESRDMVDVAVVFQVVLVSHLSMLHTSAHHYNE